MSYEFFTLRPLFSAAECGVSHVLLLHSMTKRYAVPGLRLGYVTGAPHLLHRLRTNRMPWSVNQLAMRRDSICWNMMFPIRWMWRLLARGCPPAQCARGIGRTGGMGHRNPFHAGVPPYGQGFRLERLSGRGAWHLDSGRSNFDGLNEHFFRIAAQSREENDRLVKAIGQWLEEE